MPGLGAEERLILLADVVDALDGDVPVGVGIAAPDHHRAHDVRARIVAVAVPHRRAVGMERLHLGRALGIGDGLERLVLDPHGGGRAPRLLGLLRRDDRDRLAEVADAIDREHGLVGELEAVRLRAGNVLVREHRVDAGHRARLGRVDREDARVRVRAAHGVTPEHPRGVEVARVGELARDLRDGVGAARARRRVPATKRARRGAHRSAASVNGVEDLLVPGAAAEVSGERLADLVVRRVGTAAQEIGRGDDEARRAEAALHRARVGERLLHRVQGAIAAEALDRDDVVPVGLRGEDEARAHELAVEEDGARAALALLARVLRAGELEPVAERREEALAGPDVGLAPLAVDRELDPHARHLSSARCVRTRSA